MGDGWRLCGFEGKGSVFMDRWVGGLTKMIVLRITKKYRTKMIVVIMKEKEQLNLGGGCYKTRLH